MKFTHEQIGKLLAAVSDVSRESAEMAYSEGWRAAIRDYERRINTLIALGVLPPKIKRQLIFANLVLLED